MKKLIPVLVILIALALTMNTVAATLRQDNLCYKSSGTGWICGTNPNPAYSSAKGKVTYEDVGPRLEITVELENMKPEFKYQLTLNGRNGGDGNTAIGANCPIPNVPASWYGFSVAWECGTWGSEGFWNFDMDVMTDMHGYYRETYYLNLPIGHYGPAGGSCSPLPDCNYSMAFIVKENGDVGPWTPVLMEENGLEWWIVGTDRHMQQLKDFEFAWIGRIIQLEQSIAKLSNIIHNLIDRVSDIEDFLEEYNLPPPTLCGNGLCDIGETSETCPEDCHDGGEPGEVFLSEGWKVICPASGYYHCIAKMFRNGDYITEYQLDPGKTKSVNWNAGYKLKLYGIPV